MASIHKDPRGKSPYWYCAYRLPDGRRTLRSTKQTDRKKAWAFCIRLEKAADLARHNELTEVQARKLLGEILENTGSESIRSESVRSWFIDWLANKQPSVSHTSYSLYRRTLEAFLQLLGPKADRPLAGITSRDIATYQTIRQNEGVSGGTLGLSMKVLRGVFASAKRQGLILHNPAEAVDLPVNRPVERETFSAPEIAQLLLVAAPEWQTLILLGYYLGGRLSDMASLTWEAVDLAGGTVLYTQGKTRHTVHVPIHPELETHLLAIARDSQGPLCPALSKTRLGGRNGLSDQFRALMDRAGIAANEVHGGKRTVSRKSFHSLRHSFASALANAGVSQELRMKLTGHKSPSVHRQYSHLELETLRAAVNALPRLEGKR